MNTEDRYKNLDRINYWISNCDTKVSYLLAFQGIILTIILTSGFSDTIFKVFSFKLSFENFGINSIINFLKGLTLSLSLLFAIVSISHAFISLRAKLNPRVYKERGLITNSYLYFDSIANREYLDFKKEQDDLSQQQLNDQIDSQIFINSKICQFKFIQYNQTLKKCAISLIIFLAYFILHWIQFQLKV